MRLAQYVARQQAWSAHTFGSGPRTIGITRHIEKELQEIRAQPDDLEEWIDVIILAIDGYWRHGGSPGRLLKALIAKQETNFARKWPPPQPQDHPTEHLKDEASIV